MAKGFDRGFEDEDEAPKAPKVGAQKAAFKQADSDEKKRNAEGDKLGPKDGDPAPSGSLAKIQAEQRKKASEGK